MTHTLRATTLSALLLCATPAHAQGLPEWAKESWMLRRQYEAPWALTNVQLVDLELGELRPDATIIVQGDVVREVLDGAPPEGTKTIDGEGGFVMPGLVDLHAHVVPPSPFQPGAPGPEEALALLIDHGVTTIRLLPLYSESALRFGAEVAAGKLTGPTVVPVSGIFELTGQRTSKGFGDPATARAWVHREALAGARWIKVYNKMDEASLSAIVDTAREHGMQVCGHTEDVPPLEAAELGIASIEHAISIPLSCFAGDPPVSGASLLERNIARWAAVDPERAHALVERLVETDTAWVPTLVVSEQMLETGQHDGRGVSPERLAELREAGLDGLRQAARLAVHMHRSGGRVGAGSDFPIDGLAPGSSLQRELELFVELGGATPLEALRIGTLESQRILRLDDIAGRIAPGMQADFVVLGANPLEDIGAVRDVRRVVHQGRVRVPD